MCSGDTGNVDVCVHMCTECLIEEMLKNISPFNDWGFKCMSGLFMSYTVHKCMKKQYIEKNLAGVWGMFVKCM